MITRQKNEGAFTFIDNHPSSSNNRANGNISHLVAEAAAVVNRRKKEFEEKMRRSLTKLNDLKELVNEFNVMKDDELRKEVVLEKSNRS